MAIPGIINEEDFNKLPESVRESTYKKGEDGKYYADIEEVDGWEFQNVENLRKTMRTERDRREDWERKHKELEKTLDGVDPAEIKKLDDYKKQIEEMKTWSPDDKVRARIADLEKTYQRKLTDLETKGQQDVTSRDGTIKKLLVSDKARAHLSELKCIDASLHMLDIDERTKVIDGEPVIVDKHGDPVPTKEPGKTGNMGLEEHCKALRKKHPQNFRGTKATGSGGDPSDAGGGGEQTEAFNKLTPSQRLIAIRRAQHNKT